MFHLIGIGVRKENIDDEMREAIKSSSKIYLENYTSFYEDDFKTLENYLGVEIELAERELVESQVEEKILDPALEKDVSLLVLGDPLIATTHTDLILRAQEKGVEVQIYNNVSVANFVTRTGLQFYKFGKITSIPFFNSSFMPRTPYLIYHDNFKMGAHSLFFLDLKPSTNEYLKAYEALEFMIQVPKLMKENEEIEEKDASYIDEDTHCIICSRLGFSDEKIILGRLSELIKIDKVNPLPPPVCIIFPGDLHDMEKKYLSNFGDLEEDKVEGEKIIESGI